MIDITNHEKERVKELLVDIITKKGPYEEDRHEHAQSVIDNSSKNALEAWKILFPQDRRWRGME